MSDKIDMNALLAAAFGVEDGSSNNKNKSNKKTAKFKGYSIKKGTYNVGEDTIDIISDMAFKFKKDFVDVLNSSKKNATNKDIQKFVADFVKSTENAINIFTSNKETLSEMITIADKKVLDMSNALKTFKKVKTHKKQDVINPNMETGYKVKAGNYQLGKYSISFPKDSYFKTLKSYLDSVRKAIPGKSELKDTDAKSILQKSEYKTELYADVPEIKASFKENSKEIVKEAVVQADKLVKEVDKKLKQKVENKVKKTVKKTDSVDISEKKETIADKKETSVKATAIKIAKPKKKIEVTKEEKPIETKPKETTKSGGVVDFEKVEKQADHIIKRIGKNIEKISNDRISTLDKISKNNAYHNDVMNDKPIPSQKQQAKESKEPNIQEDKKEINRYWKLKAGSYDVRKYKVSTDKDVFFKNKNDFKEYFKNKTGVDIQNNEVAKIIKDKIETDGILSVDTSSIKVASRKIAIKEGTYNLKHKDGEIETYVGKRLFFDSIKEAKTFLGEQFSKDVSIPIKEINKIVDKIPLISDYAEKASKTKDGDFVFSYAKATADVAKSQINAIEKKEDKTQKSLITTNDKVAKTMVSLEDKITTIKNENNGIDEAKHHIINEIKKAPRPDKQPLLDQLEVTDSKVTITEAEIKANETTQQLNQNQESFKKEEQQKRTDTKKSVNEPRYEDEYIDHFKQRSIDEHLKEEKKLKESILEIDKEIEKIRQRGVNERSKYNDILTNEKSTEKQKLEAYNKIRLSLKDQDDKINMHQSKKNDLEIRRSFEENGVYNVMKDRLKSSGYDDKKIDEVMYYVKNPQAINDLFFKVYGKRMNNIATGASIPRSNGNKGISGGFQPILNMDGEMSYGFFGGSGFGGSGLSSEISESMRRVGQMRTFMSHVGIISATIGNLARVEEAIFDLGVVGQRSVPEIRAMRNEFINMATTSRYSTTALATAAADVVRVGYDYKSSIKILQSGETLATASFDPSIRDSTGTLIKAMTAFQLSAASAEHAANSFHNVVNATPLDLKTFDDSLRQTAAAFGSIVTFSSKSGNELEEYKRQVLDTTAVLTGLQSMLGRTGSQAKLFWSV